MILKHVPRVLSKIRVGGDKASWVTASAVRDTLEFLIQYKLHADAVIHSPDPLGEVSVSWIIWDGSGVDLEMLDRCLVVDLALVSVRDNRPGYYREDGVPKKINLRSHPFLRPDRDL